MGEVQKKEKSSRCIRNKTTGEIARCEYKQAMKLINNGWALASKEDWKAQGRKTL